MDFKGNKVSVIGLARSGLSAALVLKERGAAVFGSDNGQPDPSGLTALKEAGIPFETGTHSDRIYDADFIVLSPGVPVNIKPVRIARARRLRVISEIELAFLITGADIVAVTGSNGKSTTVVLLGKLLEHGSFKSAVGGNIGEALSAKCAGLDKGDVLVAEVSSFQLDAIEKFRPKVAVLLNLTPDHLDRYASEEEYYASKLSITLNQRKEDVLVINADDPNIQIKKGHLQTRARVFGFSLDMELPQGAFVREGRIVYREGDREDIVAGTQGIKLIGPHNLSNILSAVVVAKQYNIADSDISAVLHGFQGIAHRLEFIRQKNGISFYNDSKATNIESLKWALKSMNGKIHLIAGGRDKAGVFEVLAPLIHEQVKAVYAIGEAAEKIAKAWGDAVPVHMKTDLEDAVRSAYDDAGKSGTVLLSPACASFDMYRNFEERGSHFKQIVEAL
jgi:UDP-N-acetylmuramoylalanine--D-glutamate ligase